MRIVLIGLVSQVFSCHQMIPNDALIKKMVEENKIDWGIDTLDYKWENLHYFAQPMYDCVIKISDKDFKKTNSYLIRYANKKDVLVEIIELNELDIAGKVYDTANKYAERIRTTRRKDYGQLCQPIKEWDFHFVHLSGKKVYLIGCINGGFVFENGDVSLETNKELLHEASLVYDYIKEYAK